MPGHTRAGLLAEIQDRRRAIETYVREKEPASTRLLTISIVSSALAAALTAGPAFGGDRFADTVQGGLSLDRPSRVWQVLCFAAVVVSVTAAVSAQLTKAHDLRARIGAAEAAGVMLDGLRTRLEFGRLSVQDAAQEYQDILIGIPFVHGTSGDRGAEPGAGGSTAPAGPRAHLRDWQLGVVAVLAALLLVATLVGFVLGLARSDGSAASGATSTVPGGATPSPTSSPTPSPTVQEAVFAGRTADDRASLAVVVAAGEAAAYLCDGERVEAWLTGRVAGDRLDLTGADGATLTGTVDGDLVSGRVVAPGLATPFTAVAVTPPAGLYRATIVDDGVEVLIRWIVLPDGDQVGLVDLGGARAEAPPLELPGATFRLGDGPTRRAERIDP